jgi:hypothetical protein
MGRAPKTASKRHPGEHSDKYGDAKEFLVMRYDGLRPMVGIRSNDVFHVLWIENEFGDLYDHGS